MAATIQTTLFSAYACAHYYMAIHQFDQLEQLHNRVIAYPILIIALGGIWDNMRLACGAWWGVRALSPGVAYTSWLIHMAVMPSLLACYSHMVDAMTGGKVTAKGAGLVVSLVLCGHGLVKFVRDVVGQLEVTNEADVARLSLPQHKKGVSFLVPIMLVGLGNIAVGVVVNHIYNDPVPLYLNIVGFVCQGFVPSLKEYGIFVSNAFEVVFVYSLLLCEEHLIDGR